jgi:hypothetical protein
VDRHVANMKEMRSTYKILVKTPKRGGHLEALGIDGRVIL